MVVKLLWAPIERARVEKECRAQVAKRLLCWAVALLD